MTHKIGFVQPNFRFGPKTANAYYLPYSVGVLWAYVNQFDFVKQNFTAGDIIFRRDPLEETAQKLARHDILIFSTYIWNKNYNYSLANRIKELNPRCVTIFGGPEVPIERKDIFHRYSFMDIVVKLEGEETFKSILANYGQNYEHIPGLLINDGGQVINTGNSTRIDSLEHLPSPYLIGFFDNLIRDYPEIAWMWDL